ncbi:hypothetical protein [Shinella sp. BYT-45]|uniref:hypothetical protein n=1 Tax=Shinella sp. BYT-45 TaxID=3377377 RepID=UPI00397F3089
MAEFIAFRVHFQGEDAPPFDVLTVDAADARKRAEIARPGEIVRKVKVVRAGGPFPTSSISSTTGETP